MKCIQMLLQSSTNSETKKTEDDTKPDTTKPDTTKPDTTKPDTTKPYTTKPDTPAASTTKRSAKDHNITKDNGNNNENDASTKSVSYAHGGESSTPSHTPHPSHEYSLESSQ